MIERDKTILGYRPKIDSIQNSQETKPVESFQNDVLRPILKFQHKLLIAYFNSQNNSKNLLEQSKPHEYEQIIKNELNKHIVLWNTLLGFIIGLLGEQEIEYYCSEQKVFNKRIKNMLAQRIASAI